MVIAKRLRRGPNKYLFIFYGRSQKHKSAPRMSLRIGLMGLTVGATCTIRAGGPTGPGGRLSGPYLRRLSGDNSSDHYSYLRRLSKGNFVGPYLRRLSGDNSQNIRRSKIGQNPDRIYYGIFPKVCSRQEQILHLFVPQGREGVPKLIRRP